MSTVDKLTWLIQQPISRFDSFNAALIMSVWCEMEGNFKSTDLVSRIGVGKLECLNKLYDLLKEEDLNGLAGSKNELHYTATL